MADLDCDSIREADGFKVGDHVRARGQDVGTILHLVQVKGGRIRAHIHWPTIPFECEGGYSATGRGSENFVDLVKLTKVLTQVNEQQLTLI